MTYAFIPLSQAATAVPTSRPLSWRTPTERLIHARQDHATCLRLAASYRVRLTHGEAGVRGMHDWAIGHARILRLRFSGRLSAPVA